MRKAAAGQAPGGLQTPGAQHGPGGSHPPLVVPAAPRPPRAEPEAASFVTGCVLAGRVCWGCSGGWESLETQQDRGLAAVVSLGTNQGLCRTAVFGLDVSSGTPVGAGGGAGERSCSFSTGAHLRTPARTPAGTAGPGSCRDGRLSARNAAKGRRGHGSCISREGPG